MKPFLQLRRRFNRRQGQGRGQPRPATRPSLELLEDRTVLSGDWADPNGTLATALDLRDLYGKWTLPTLSTYQYESDYFRLTTTQAGTVSANISYNSALGIPELLLYDVNGNVLAYSYLNASSQSVTANLSAGTYYVGVYGAPATTSPNYFLNYTLQITTPGVNGFANRTADRFESNNTLGTATNLGSMEGDQFFNDLSIDTTSDTDYFRFVTDRTAGSGNYVHIDFNSRLGPLGLALYDAYGNVVNFVTGTGGGNGLTLSLGGLPAGTYYTEAYSYNGSINTDYTLEINAPPDRFEPNDNILQATYIGPITTPLVLDDLSITPGDQDWFYVQTEVNGTSQNYARLDFNASQGHLGLDVYDAWGDYLGSSTADSNGQYLSLNTLPAGGYYLAIHGVSGASNPYYKLTIVPPAITPDRFEPNNTSATATNLGTVKGQQAWNNLSIDSPADVDWFKFQTTTTGTPDSVVRIDTTYPQDTLEVALYDAVGRLLGYTTGYGASEQLSLAGLAAGSYYAVAYGYYGVSNPNYTLTVNAPGIVADRFEPNNTFATATPLGTVAGQEAWTNLSLDNPNDIDWYKFATTAGGGASNFVRLDFQGSQGSVAVGLYDSQGRLLNGSRAAPSDVQLISLAGLPAGTYYLAVFPNFVGGTNPSYTLTINAPGITPDQFDTGTRNDTFATATALGSVAGSVSWNNLSIDSSTDVDWYKFTTTAAAVSGNVVHIDFLDAQGDLDLELYDSQNHLLGFSYGVGDSEEVSLAGLAAGTYYVRVFGYGHAINPNYTLTIAAPGGTGTGDPFEPDETWQTAHDFGTLHGPNTWAAPNYPLAISDGNDQDWYKFQTTATGVTGDTAAIAFDNLNNSSSRQLALELYYQDKPADTPALVATSNAVGDIEAVSLQGRPAGTYYLHVFGYHGAFNPAYALFLNTPGGDWAEANDTTAQATSLGPVAGFNTWKNLSIEPASPSITTDVDWFKFSTSAAGIQGDAVRIDFSSPLGDLALDLYQSDGTTRIATSDGADNFEQVSLAGLPAGTYYAKVYGHTAAVTNPLYALSITAPELAAADWAEPNNSRQTAYDFHTLQGLHVWGNDQAHPLSIDTAGQQDWFQLTTTGTADNSHFAAIVFNSAAAALNLQLYKSDGTLLSSADVGGGVESVSLAGLPAGTYYVEVAGDTAATTNPRYALVINAPGTAAGSTGDWAEPNNSFQAAYDLRQATGTETVTGLSISPAGDQDWFHFSTVATGDPNSAVGLVFNSAQGALHLELYDKQDHLIAAADAASNAQQVSLAGLPPGDYYVHVYAAGGVTNPNYSLVITAPVGDWAEAHDDANGNHLTDNNTRAHAYDLHALQGLQTYDNLSIPSGDQDWFSFTTAAAGVDGTFAGIAYDHTAGDLDLELYDAAGKLLAQSADVADDTKRLSLKGLAAGTYYVHVLGHAGATNGNYSLVIDAPTTQGAPDWAEPNNNPSDATDRSKAYDLHQVTGLHSWSGLSIDSTTDVDWFTFGLAADVPAGAGNESLGITYDRTLGDDLDVELYNSSGTLLSTSTGPSDRQQVALAGLKAGTYFVRVKAHNGGTNPSYTLFISTPTALQPDWAEQHDGKANNNTTANAYDMRQVDGATTLANLSIDSATDVDWFRFGTVATGTTGQNVRIDFDHTLGALTLGLYDANGNALNVPVETGTDYADVSLAGQTKGTYYVKISGAGGATNPSYVLTINGPRSLRPDWAEVHDDGSGHQLADNNSAARAYDLSDLESEGFSGSARSLTDTRGGQSSLASLLTNLATLTAFSHLVTGLSSALNQTQSPQLTGVNHLLYPGGLLNTSLLSGPLSGGLTSFTPSQHSQFSQLTGQSANSPLSGSISAAWNPFSTASINNPFVNGSYLSFGGNSNLGVTQSTLAWALQGTGLEGLANGAGGINNPVVTGGVAGGLVNNQLNSLGLSGLGGSGGYGLGLGNSNLSLSNPLAGQSPSNIFGNIYNSTLNSLSSGGINGSGAIAGIPLNLLFAADSTGVQPTAVFSNLSIDSASDVDWFKIQLGADGSAGQFARITFDHNAGNLVLQLYAADGTTLLDSSDKAGQDQQQVGLAGLPKGVYYVKVAGLTATDTNPNYALDFDVTPPAPPGGDWAEGPGRNDTQATAHDLRTVEGSQVLSDLSIDSPTDVDWYKFTTTTTAVAGNFVQINFDNHQGDLDLALVDATGKVLAQSTGAGNSEKIDLSQLPNGQTTYALTAGTYFVKVYGYEGATNPQYTLTLNVPTKAVPPDALENNNTLGQATNLDTFGGVSNVPGLTITPGDVDYFRFTVGAADSAAHSAGITFDPGSGSLLLQLLDANGNAVSGHTATGSNGALTVSLSGLATGTYYLKVSGATSTVANYYALQLNLPPNAAATPNTWTIMIYMTASTLAQFATLNIEQMERAAALLPGTVHIAVLLDQSTKSPSVITGNGAQSWGGTGEAIIQPSTNATRITTTFDTSPGDLDTGNPTTLVNFINWAAAHAPAQHYALVMWDHGGGVQGLNFDDQDFAAPDHMTVSGLAGALKTVSTQSSPVHIDVLGFDECLMQMAEVGFKVSPYVGDVVASEEVVGGTGYDYRTAFATLLTNPGQVSAQTVAAGLVQSYQGLYGLTTNADTLSAANATGYAALDAALQTFTTAADNDTSSQDWSILRADQSLAVTFTDSPNYRDLGQYFQALAGSTSLPAALKSAAQGVLNALHSLLVARASDRRNTSGLSIYFPPPGVSPDASYLSEFTDFFAATGWDAFLKNFTNTQSKSSGIAPDFAEPNNNEAQSYNLHRLTGPSNTFAGLSISQAGEQDWFRFFTQVTGGSQDNVSVSTSPSSAALHLSVYDGNNNVVGQATTNASGQASISLNGEAAGQYFVEVTADPSAVVPLYTLSVSLPSSSAGASDWVRGNDTQGKAHDLGIISGAAVFSGLALTTDSQGQTAPNWFTFEAPKTLDAAAVDLLTVTPAGGQSLTVQLLDAQGNSLGSQSGSGPLRLRYPLTAGASYQLEVSGSAGGYAIAFDPPSDGVGPTVTDVTSTTANGTYTPGATILIDVTFSAPVTVTGTPQLALSSGGTANYSGGSGSATLVFTYVVGAGQASPHLDDASTTALVLNGGTIVDASLNPATLTLPAAGSGHALGDTTALVIPPVVTGTGDSGAGSLRWAVTQADAWPGAVVITFDASAFGTAQTITLTGGPLSLTNTTGLTVQGPGASLLTISGNSTSRAFIVPGGATAALSGLTISNGKVQYDGSDATTGLGGAVRNNGTLTVTNCTFSKDSAGGTYGDGGAIYSNGPLTVTGSTFSNDSASNVGGAICGDSSGTLTVTGSTFSNDSAAYGGGVYTVGTTTLTGSTFSSDSASYGGGLYVVATTTLTGCTFSTDTASSGGGGIFSDARLTVTGSTLTGNSATASGSNGGGIWLYTHGTLTVTGSTLSGNSAVGNGGGLVNQGTATLTGSTFSTNSAAYGGGACNFGTLTLVSSTLGGNSAVTSGGTVYTNTTVTLTDSTLSGNSATYGGGIFANAASNAAVTLTSSIVAADTAPNGPDVYGPVQAASSYNLIGNGAAMSGISQGSNSNLVGTAASPINPLLAALGSYGGTTKTMPLLPGSPALGAGNPNAKDANGNPITADQRGLSRTVNGRTDAGAFESQGFTVSKVSGDGQNAALGTAFANPLVVRVTPVTAGDPVQGGQITFTGPASGAGISPTSAVVTIDASGQASLAVSANTTFGPYQVTAAAAGAGSPAAFSLSNGDFPTSVTSSTANGSYAAGASIVIDITFNLAVTVTGTPQLALNSGGTATYSGGSGTSTLAFTYVVAAGDSSSHLDYTATTSLTLPGAATIKDANNGGNASLTLAAPGAAGSLGAASSLVIDTTPPAASITSQPPLLTSNTSATFAFTGTDNFTTAANLTYQASLDGAAYTSAVSPVSTSNLTEGPHTFQVEAIDQAGNVSAPASYTWVVSDGPTMTVTNATVAANEGVAVANSGTFSDEPADTNDPTHPVSIVVSDANGPVGTVSVTRNPDGSGTWAWSYNPAVGRPGWTYDPATRLLTATLTVTATDKYGAASSVTFLIKLTAALRVTSFTPTYSGFTLTLNQAVDTSVLNLYDSPGPNGGTLGAADLTVIGAGPDGKFGTADDITWPGTLVIDPAATTLRWVRLERTAAGALDPQGSVLPDDTYRVTLRSAANAFRGTDSRLLDGNADGVPGGDYVTTFTKTTPATIPAGTVAPGEADAVTFDRTARVVSLRQFARGPGQVVNLPNPSSAGLPVTLSDGSNVRAVDLTVRFNPALLQLAAATTAVANFSVTSTIDNTHGVATFSVRGTASAPSGPITLLNIPASVPSANAAAIYLQKEVLDIDLSSLNIGDGSGHAFPKEDGDGVHAAIFLGDVTGNGEINAADASQVALNGAYSPYGFAGTPLLDPLLVGDVTDNGQINGADASEVAKRAAGLNPAYVPNYTPLTSAPGGIDPKVYVQPNTSATPGAAVSVPVLLDTLGQGLTGSSAVTGFRLALTYDPAVLSYTGLGSGDLMNTAGTTWAATVNNSVAGQLVIVGFETSGKPVAFGAGVDTIEGLVKLNFTAAAGTGGSTVVNLANQVQGRTTELNGVGNVLLTLAPAPSDGSDPDDGLVNFAQPPNRPPFDAVPPASALPPVPFNPPGAAALHGLTLSGGTAIVVSDPDAGSSPVRTTVSIGHGTLTLSGTAGLAVAGNGTGTVTMTGAMSDINKALNGLKYVPGPGFSGTDTLMASTNDLGHSGAGGPQSDSHSTTISVVGRPNASAGSFLAPSGGPVGAAIAAPYSGAVSGGAVPGSGGTASASNGSAPAIPGDEFWRLYGATPGPRPAERPGDLGYLDYDPGGATDVLDPAQFLDRRGTTSKP